MNVQQLLNSDMSTLGSMLGSGWRWWIDELRDLLPARLGASGSAEARVAIDRALTVCPVGQEPLPHGTAAVALDKAIALVRRVDLPPLSRRDLALLLENESDRFFPFATGDALIAHRIEARRNDPPGLSVMVGALPMARARTIADGLRESDISPTALLLQYGAAREEQLDFVPAMNQAGLIESRVGSSRWWIAVAALFALNVGGLIWRDASEVATIEQLVADQAPAVAAAQRIARVMERSQRSARRLATLRQEPTALGTLGQVSTALPDYAWVQRYNWTGDSVRIAGYQAGTGNLVSDLRGTRRFATVKPAQAESLGATPAGRPFDINLGLRRGGS